MDQEEKEKIRKKELRKLNRIFKNISKEKQQLAEGLATLAELQDIMNRDGPVKLFEQGVKEVEVSDVDRLMDGKGGETNWHRRNPDDLRS